MKFSENLKTQRILNGVKQEDIAILCDVTRSAVSNWENGRRLPQLSTIQTLTKFFNITIEELMGSDIQFIEYLEKESIVTPDEPKHFSKIPMIFALLTLVVVTLLTILIVPVVKDKYINNGNVNEVEYIDANSISKVKLTLEYYSEIVSVDFVECMASRMSNEIQTDNGKIYIIENLQISELFIVDEWGMDKFVKSKLYIQDKNTYSLTFIEKIDYLTSFNETLNNKDEGLFFKICKNYSLSFYISNNKYYLDVLQIN